MNKQLLRVEKRRMCWRLDDLSLGGEDGRFGRRKDRTALGSAGVSRLAGSLDRAGPKNLSL